jgi:hypothetical protein
MILFYHLPRTAGLSIVEAAKRDLPGTKKRVFLPDMTIWLDRLRDGLEDLSDVSFLSGHFAYGIEAFLPFSASTFTLLRNPLEQIFSMEAQAKKLPDRYPQGALTDLLTTPAGEPYFDNPQIRHLAGDGGVAVRGPLSDAHLARAKSVVEHRMTAFGISEYFEASLAVISAALGITLRPQHTNASNRPPLSLVSEEVLHLAWLATSLDRHLYDFGRSLFMERLSQLPNVKRSRVAVRAADAEATA